MPSHRKVHRDVRVGKPSFQVVVGSELDSEYSDRVLVLVDEEAAFFEAFVDF